MDYIIYTFAPMDITYDQLYTRCEALSAYEGSRIVDASGKNMFPKVHMVEQDMPLLKEYSNDAALLVGSRLKFAVTSVTLDSTCDESKEGIAFTFVSESMYSELENTIESILVSFIMWHWLSDKDANRGNVWKNIYDEMMASLSKGVAKKRPTLNA